MNIKNILLLLLAVTGFIVPLLSTATEPDDSLLVENAWIAEAPPVSKVMVAYMILKNIGQDDIEIISATSGMYSSIEFHETVYKDGMASMIHHESLTIPANGQFELKQGGPHLMLFNPVKPLTAGDTVNITFTTSGNTTKTVSVAVKKAQ
jgi:copper(I)-binding protein